MLDPEGIVEFEAAGEKYRLFFGIRAEKATELHYDQPFFRAVQRIVPDLKPDEMGDKAKVAEASANIRFNDVAKMFEFALLKFQPEIDESAVEDIIDELGLARTSELLGQALSAAMGSDDEGAEAGADANPPKASRKSKTGSRSLVTG
jgi:hypothetical protein